MKMEVEIITIQNIKPSSPTLEHLKIFNLSLLDQLIPSPYAPLIFFYPTTTTILNIPKRVNLLNKSLSNTLTHFNPLAGKMRDHFSIDCNDEGACFIQARVNCHLKDFLTQPDLVSLNCFLPCGFSRKESLAGTHVSNFQVNIFECGGMAIGICISHKILDGAAMSTFLKAWSAASCGCSEFVHPNFFAYSTDLFIPVINLDPSPVMSTSGKCVTRRFVFDATALGTLKSQATDSSSSTKVPTRVEGVSAIVWKSAIATSKAKHGFQKPSVSAHLVNLRKRISPPSLAENSIGNLLWIAVAEHGANSKSDLHDLIRKMREAISKIDGAFVKKFADNPPISESFKGVHELESRRDEIDYFGFIV
ncbi:hypothetical protein SLA2020_198550 [Shorea laevis]